jgi:hypothetical protein
MGTDCLAWLGFHGYITYNLQLMWPWKSRHVLYCRAKKDKNSVMYPWEQDSDLLYSKINLQALLA